MDREAHAPRFRALGLRLALAGLVAALGRAASSAAEAGPWMEPRVVGWEELTRCCFDDAWVLPRPDVDDDLVAAMKALAAERFSTDIDARQAPAVATGWWTSLGELLAHLEPLTNAARRSWLDAFARRAPDAWSRWGEVITALALDGDVDRDDWHPDTDTASDGFFAGAAYTVPDDRAPWEGIVGSRRVQQMATTVRADDQTLKHAEHDYASYAHRRGADYEWIAAAPGSYLVSAEDAARAFAALRLTFRCDLPFPFSGYDCELDAVVRRDVDGHLVSDFYSTSDDFHWLAGRDVYIPVRRADGRRFTTIVVRQMGFDLDGVPDGDGHRLASIRGSLGNLKRHAEPMFAARTEEPPTTPVPSEGAPREGPGDGAAPPIPRLRIPAGR